MSLHYIFVLKIIIKDKAKYRQILYYRNKINDLFHSCTYPAP